MTDKQIREKISEYMENLAKHEKYVKSGTAMLSMDPIQQGTIAGLKALIDQHKIIIRQNELILRALNRLSKKRVG